MIHIFGHWFPASSLLGVLLDLALVCLCVFLGVSWYDQVGPGSAAAVLPYLLPFGLGVLAALGVRHAHTAVPGRALIGASAWAVMGALLAIPAAYAVSGLAAAPWRWHPELAVLFTLGAAFVLRGPVMQATARVLWRRRVMVLGTGVEAAAVDETQARAGSGMTLVGFYPGSSYGDHRVDADRILLGFTSLAHAARALRVDQIVVALDEASADTAALHELMQCRLAGVTILSLSSFFERTCGQVRLEPLQASWFIFSAGFRSGRLSTGGKRLFDIVASALLLALLWPLMAFTAMLIVLESGFPAFYRQVRSGQDGRPFNVFKFRSMRTDAEAGGTPCWAGLDDPRITRVGRVLRRLRIDELPQLCNVLAGRMSLVGPRPERPYFVDRLTRDIPFYAARHCVKPGITGWAQVRFAYGGSVDDARQKLQYDLYYVKNRSLFLDVLILLHTIRVVLTGAGAR